MSEEEKTEAASTPEAPDPMDVIDTEIPTRDVLHGDIVFRARNFIKIEIGRGCTHSVAVSSLLGALAAAFDGGWSDNPATSQRMEADATALAKFIVRFVEGRFRGKIGLNYLVCLFFYALCFTAKNFGRPMNAANTERLNGHARNSVG